MKLQKYQNEFKGVITVIWTSSLNAHKYVITIRMCWYWLDGVRRRFQSTIHHPRESVVLWIVRKTSLHFMIPCSMMGCYHCFGWTCCMHVQEDLRKLKTEASDFSEMLVTTYQIARYHNQQNQQAPTHHSLFTWCDISRCLYQSPFVVLPGVISAKFKYKAWMMWERLWRLGELEQPWAVRVNCFHSILLERAKETRQSR
jgi:hypothetical protein